MQPPNLSDCLDAVLLISTDMATLDCYVLSTKRAVFVDTHIKMSLLSMKMAVFVDGNGKMSTLSIKRGVFVDEVRDICYICMMS